MPNVITVNGKKFGNAITLHLTASADSDIDFFDTVLKEQRGRLGSGDWVHDLELPLRTCHEILLAQVLQVSTTITLAH